MKLPKPCWKKGRPRVCHASAPVLRDLPLVGRRRIMELAVRLQSPPAPDPRRKIHEGAQPVAEARKVMQGAKGPPPEEIQWRQRDLTAMVENIRQMQKRVHGSGGSGKGASADEAFTFSPPARPAVPAPATPRDRQGLPVSAPRPHLASEKVPALSSACNGDLWCVCVTSHHIMA